MPEEALDNSLMEKPLSPWLSDGRAPKPTWDTLTKPWHKAWRAYRLYFWPLNAFALCLFGFGVLNLPLHTPASEGFNLNQSCAQLGLLILRMPLDAGLYSASCLAIQGINPIAGRLMLADMRTTKIFGINFLIWLAMTLQRYFFHAPIPSTVPHTQHHFSLFFYLVIGALFICVLLPLIFLIGLFITWMELAQILIIRGKKNPFKTSWQFTNEQRWKYLCFSIALVALVLPHLLGFFSGTSSLGHRLTAELYSSEIGIFGTLFLAAYSYQLVPEKSAS
jgi:hypothetical protein